MYTLSVEPTRHVPELVNPVFGVRNQNDAPLPLQAALPCGKKRAGPHSDCKGNGNRRRCTEAANRRRILSHHLRTKRPESHGSRSKHTCYPCGTYEVSPSEEGRVG